jgi:DNA primase
MTSLAHSLDWRKICRELNIPSKKRSTGVRIILCPFHNEKTPSCHLWPKSGRFRCFGCGRGGNQEEFLEMSAGIPKEDLENYPWLYSEKAVTLGQTSFANI